MRFDFDDMVLLLAFLCTIVSFIAMLSSLVCDLLNIILG